jgi:hypothetical protein
MRTEMGPAGFEPATNRLCIPLRFSPPLSGLWAGLSLHPDIRPRVPAIQSLHLPASCELGSGLPYHHVGLGFPEFDRYHLPVSR